METSCLHSGNNISKQLPPFVFPKHTSGHDENVVQLTDNGSAPSEERMASNHLIELLNDLFETHSDMSTMVNMSKSNQRNTIDTGNETIRNKKCPVECCGNGSIDSLMSDMLDYSCNDTRSHHACGRSEPTCITNISIQNATPTENEWGRSNPPELTCIVNSVLSNGDSDTRREFNTFNEPPRADSGREIVADSLSNTSNSSTDDIVQTSSLVQADDTPASNIEVKRTLVSSEESDSSSSKGRKRAGRNESVPCHDPLSICLPPCRVCNEKASGFHYGANTCEACKGFFRRTLAKKRVVFPCRCDEDKQEAWKEGPVRNGCASCRYKRCLFVGMDKKAIKIGRYTLMRKSENIKEVKTLETLTNTSSNTMHEGTRTHEQDSLSGVNKCLDYYQYSSPTEPRRSSEVCHHDTIAPLSSEHVAATSPMKIPRMETKAFDWTTKRDNCKGSEITEIDIDVLVKALLDTRSVQCSGRCPNKKEHLASMFDECYEKYKLKTALFGEMKPPSMSEHMEIYKATGIDIDDRVDDIRGAFAFFERKVRHLIEFGKAIPGFKDLDLEDQASLIKATRVESSFIGGYRRFLSKCNMDLQVAVLPWGKAYHLNELAKIWPKEYIMQRFIIAQDMQSLGMTPGEEQLMRAIAITSGDRCQLKEPTKVKKINEHMHRCLHHLFSKRPDGADLMMSKVFEISKKFGNLRDLDNKISKELFLGWPSLSNYHLVTEFFS